MADIIFGGMAPPLYQQLGVKAKDLEFEQRMADGIALCAIHGILTERETHAARKRLAKKISQKVTKIRESQVPVATEEAACQ